MLALLANPRLKGLTKVVFGFNGASLRHLMNSGPTHFLRACRRAATAAWHTESRSLSEIPEICLTSILDNKVPLVCVSVTPYEDGMLPTEQAITLLSILVADGPAEVLEIGTYIGYTTKLMAQNLPMATVHTVDLPESYSLEDNSAETLPKDDFSLIKGRTVGREFKGYFCEDRIKQHFADTATWNFHQAKRATFFFIDGSHTYEYCKNDSEKCFALCDGRGVFVWHDCDDNHPGVLALLLEWRRLGRDVRRISGTPLAYWSGKRPEFSV